MSAIGSINPAISELREFAGFSACEQRYIKRSLDVALGRGNAAKLWARDADELAAIRRQYGAYRRLIAMRAILHDRHGLDGHVLDELGDFFTQLLRMTTFDLEQGRITSFIAYRFLYERLLGAGVRPWSPSAFCAAATLPQIRPAQRKLLLHSLSEGAATATAWSKREPSFYPEWIAKEAA